MKRDYTICRGGLGVAVALLLAAATSAGATGAPDDVWPAGGTCGETAGVSPVAPGEPTPCEKTLSPNGTRPTGVAVGETCPSLAFPALDETSRIEVGGGRMDEPVLLVFWSLFCPTCMEELPRLGEVVEVCSRYGVRTVAVNVDEERYRAVVRRYWERIGVEAPAARDAMGAEGPEGARVLGLTGTPGWVLVDAEGRLRWRDTGRVSPQDLESVLRTARRGEGPRE